MQIKYKRKGKTFTLNVKSLKVVSEVIALLNHMKPMGYKIQGVYDV